MNYNLKLSLEQLALIKVAITLWTNDEINNVSKLTILLEIEEKEEKWQEIEDRVIEKTKQLSQPEFFKEKISSLVRPIGLKIMQWIDTNKDLCNNGNYDDIDKIDFKGMREDKIEEMLVISYELFWTPQGTVNGKKTAEMLIKDENFDIKKRYILACHYCLEKDIVELWNRMPEQYKQHFYRNEGPKSVSQPYLIVHWTYTIQGEVDRMNEMTWNNYSAFKCSFIKAVDYDNLEAAKFFLPKLSASERNKTLVEVAFYQIDGLSVERSTDMWCFLLSQLDEDQQTKLLKEEISIFYSFLKWPWQSLFMEIAKRVITDGTLVRLSVNIIREIVFIAKRGYRDYNYQNFIREFWHFIPKTHKKHIIKIINDCEPKFLLQFLEMKDMDNFYLILQEATAKECLQIFCDEKYEVCDNYAILTPSLLKSIWWSSSSTDFVQFVKEFKVRILCGRSEQEIEKEKGAWDRLFREFDYYVLRKKEC